MNNNMTFNEIEKEFDELFVKKVMLIDEPDKLAYEEMKYQERFIKLLTKENN